MKTEAIGGQLKFTSFEGSAGLQPCSDPSLLPPRQGILVVPPLLTLPLFLPVPQHWLGTEGHCALRQEVITPGGSRALSPSWPTKSVTASSQPLAAHPQQQSPDGCTQAAQRAAILLGPLGAGSLTASAQVTQWAWTTLGTALEVWGLFHRADKGPCSLPSCREVWV